MARNSSEPLLSEVTLAINAYKHFLEHVIYLKTLYNISELVTYWNVRRA